MKAIIGGAIVALGLLMSGTNAVAGSCPSAYACNPNNQQSGQVPADPALTFDHCSCSNDHYERYEYFAPEETGCADPGGQFLAQWWWVVHKDCSESSCTPHIINTSCYWMEQGCYWSC
jgi:hypothetical protein